LDKLLSLEGKVAIITGSARGLGKDIALKLAKAGCKGITLNSVRSTGDRLHEISQEINKHGVETLEIRADVSVKAQVEKLFEETYRKWGHIDILINNAAICSSSTFFDTSLDEWDTLININLKGTFICMQEAAKYMKNQNSGWIVNISSTAGITGGSVGPHYGISKAGVINLTKSAGKQLAKYGIYVNAVAPGDMKTEMLEAVISDNEVKKQRLKNIPLGRIGDTEEIANVVLFLVSPMSSYIVGETIRVSGGRI